MGGTVWDVKHGGWPRFVETDGLRGLVLVNLTRWKRHRDSQWSDSISNLCRLQAWYELLLKSNQNATILWLDRLNPIIAQLLTPIQKSTILAVLKPMVTCGTPL